MKLEEMREEIAGHPDLKEEKTRIDHFLNKSTKVQFLYTTTLTMMNYTYAFSSFCKKIL